MCALLAFQPITQAITSAIIATPMAHPASLRRGVMVIHNVIREIVRFLLVGGAHFNGR